MKSEDYSLELPTEPYYEPPKLESVCQLIYGVQKIGKSTYASEFEDPFFIATEPGLNFLKTRDIYCRDWKHFRLIVKKMEKDFPKNFKCGTIVVDRIDTLYSHCFSYVCKKENFHHPSDPDWGRGWDALSKEWTEWISRLALIGPGVVFISLSKTRKVKTNGMEIDRIEPSLPGAAYRSLGFVDYVFYAGWKDKLGASGKVEQQRVLYLKSTRDILAGCRGEPEMVKALPETVSFSYKALKRALEKARIISTEEKQQ